jgi:quinol---cytochrome-c reductase cytochrome c subunit
VRDRSDLPIWLVAVGCAAFALVWLARPGATQASVETQRATDVQHVFLRDCATCHGADGRGTDLGPDLRGAGAALVDYYLSTGRMPLQSPHEQVHRDKPKYSPATIHELVAYVTALVGGGGPPIPAVDVAAGDLARGGTLYRFQCAACHAWSGDGGALLHREAPSVHPATPLQVAEAVRGGPGNMPAFGDAALTPSQLQSLVGYVRYLDHPNDRGGTPLWHLGPLPEGAIAVFIGLGALLLAIRWIGTRT